MNLQQVPSRSTDHHRQHQGLLHHRVRHRPSRWSVLMLHRVGRSHNSLQTHRCIHRCHRPYLQPNYRCNPLAARLADHRHRYPLACSGRVGMDPVQRYRLYRFHCTLQTVHHRSHHHRYLDSMGRFPYRLHQHRHPYRSRSHLEYRHRPNQDRERHRFHHRSNRPAYRLH